MSPKSDARVGQVGVIVSAISLSAIALLLTYSLIVFWPPESEAPDPSIVFLGIRLDRPTLTVSLFMVVGLAGGIGGCIHALRSLYWYVGNRNLLYSWLLMYFWLPLVGAMLAIVTYLVLRGGLTSPGASSESINPYGLVAVGALVGLFSQEASEKLHEVFETILTPAEKGKDQAIELSITDVEPRSGQIGTQVKLNGAGLSSVTAIEIGGATVTTFERISDNELHFLVPHDATTGQIRATGPSGRASTAFDFEVK